MVFTQTCQGATLKRLMGEFLRVDRRREPRTHADLRSGDVIGVLCGKKKARFRVVWTRYDGTGDRMQVAHRVEAEECPWAELLNEKPDTAAPEGLSAPTP